MCFAFLLQDIEKKVGKIAEQTAETTTHIFTSWKFLAIIAAVFAVAVGLGYRYVRSLFFRKPFPAIACKTLLCRCSSLLREPVVQPEEFKARIASARAAVIGDKEFEFPSLPDGFPKLPDGFPKLDIFQRDDNSSMIGQMLRQEGLRPKYPFIIVPGFVTSGLELWHGEECAKRFFR